MAHKLVWGSDLYKGFKLDKNTLMGGQISDILPFQMLTLEEKTIDWVKAVADYYEVAGWGNVERKAARIHRNYEMRYGKLTKSDYIINPTYQELNAATSLMLPSSPLEQFYMLAPTFVDVLRGEFIKRDNTWTVETVDPFSISEAFEKKKSEFEAIISQFAMLQKQDTLAQMGLTEKTDPQKYSMEMESAMNQLREVEFKSKTFRTVGAKWAEKVLKIHDKRYNLSELEPDAFESGLITDSEFWHLDLLEDDFKLELLNPKYCDYHKGPNIKYVSQGDYFLWFDFMSSGDIVNKFGRKMKEEDILKLRDIYIKTANIIVPDYLKGRQGEYYDASKPWLQATELNPDINDALLGKELAYNYMRTPNFDHNIDVDILNPIWGRRITGHPQMFRVMRLYWRSMKKIGWLTKINRDGTVEQPDWVDENYKVTIEPEYDNSVVKEKTKDNLIYGEHIDWTWTNEWRHVIKISPNQKHTFWLNAENTFQSVYIDGGPVKFQFKGRNNPFDSLPPVEGCIYSYINSEPHSFIDRIRPLQIIYNICMNKVPKKFLEDKGLKVAVDRRSYPTNNASNTASGMTPREEYEQLLDESQILEYSFTRESLEGLGQPPVPSVINLSTAQEAQFYLQAADQIKWMAGESIGITRQRMGAQKASETAFSVDQGIQYSETQTEKYFEQHSKLMERVRQRMLDAAQYYSTFNDTTREIYMNDMYENVFLQIEGMENMLPHYNIYLESKANVRSALQMITNFLMNENTLPIAPSAKLEAIIGKSIPKVLSLVKESEIEQTQREQEQSQREYELEQQKLKAQQDLQNQTLANENDQNDKDRATQVQVATIRALGGLQSDNNQNTIPDSAETLAPYLKQQELKDKVSMAKEKNDIQRQTDLDRMLVEKEKSLNDIKKEKIKGEYALKIAKENTRQKG